MDVLYGKIKRPCAICGCQYETLVVDNHITYPNICGDCTKKILLEAVKEKEKENDEY